jgi:hypothetical protein
MDVRGHAADVWGQGVASSISPSPTGIRPGGSRLSHSLANPEKASDGNRVGQRGELTVRGVLTATFGGSLPTPPRWIGVDHEFTDSLTHH